MIGPSGLLLYSTWLIAMVSAPDSSWVLGTVRVSEDLMTCAGMIYGTTVRQRSRTNVPA